MRQFALLRTCQMWIQLHLPNLVPHPLALCWKLVLSVSPDFQHCNGWEVGASSTLFKLQLKNTDRASQGLLSTIVGLSGLWEHPFLCLLFFCRCIEQELKKLDALAGHRLSETTFFACWRFCDVNLGDWYWKLIDLSWCCFCPYFLHSWSEDSRGLCTPYNQGPEVGESSAMYEFHGKQKYKPSGNLCWRYTYMCM